MMTTKALQPLYAETMHVLVDNSGLGFDAPKESGSGRMSSLSNVKWQ